MIRCETQQEVDHYWRRLTEGGDPNAQQCGWLKDKFGVSWQVVPAALENLIGGPDPVKGQRAFAAMVGRPSPVCRGKRMRNVAPFSGSDSMSSVAR